MALVIIIQRRQVITILYTVKNRQENGAKMKTFVMKL
jgi:hypothetical protein